MPKLEQLRPNLPARLIVITTTIKLLTRTLEHGFAVHGFAVCGFAVHGFAVCGFAVHGFAVCGFAVHGFAVCGFAVHGFAVFITIIQ